MVFEKIKNIISEELNIPENDINLETSFVDDLNADSLDIFQIIMAIEEEFDFEVEDEDIEKITTVETVVEYIENKTNLD